MKSQIRNSKLVIDVQEKSAMMQCGEQQAVFDLHKKPLLRGIAKVVANPRQITAIAVRLHNATFSTTRQIVVIVNTLAWQLGVKVNGQRQMKATYSGEPNITKPRL
mgnify:CR=1 FL=1